MKNQYLKLLLSFSPDALRADLARCQEPTWVPHFNTADYTGRWSSIALRSASGRASDILAHENPNGYQNTNLLAACPYFSEILSQFQTELQTVRLLSLAPGSCIAEHTDAQLGYEYGCFRLHIPIQTGDAVRFTVAGADLPMQVGECWYANFHLPHSVHNQGTTDRIHLVIDGLRNAWTDELFEKAGYDVEQEKQNRDYSLETKRRMMAELEYHPTAAAQALIRQLKAEIDQHPTA